MNKDRRIVLYNPQPDATLKTAELPLALLCISSIPFQQGYDIRIISHHSENSPIDEQINRECAGALCVGVTAFTGNQIKDGLMISRVVKNAYPELPVVWGGWHPSLMPMQTIADPHIDIVVKGQGERTFSELVDALYQGKSLKDIEGLVFKEGDKIHSNPDRKLEDLNNFPPVPFEIVDIEKYVVNYSGIGSRSILYRSSHGCPFRCGFCSESVVNKSRWFGLKAQRVLDDFEKLHKKYNINGIIPVDSNFFVDKKRVREICQGILERKLKICWGNVDGRTNHLIKFEDELWMLMKKSGCRIILAGAESGDQSTLELIQKKTTVEDTYRLMEKCHQYNMKVIFSCMIGFPRKNMNREENIKEVDKEIAAAIKMIDQLNSIEPQWIQLFNYLPYPGTALYDDAVKCGFKEPESLEAWGVFNFHEKKNPWVEERQVKFVNMLAYYILKFLNPYADVLPDVLAKKYLRPLGWAGVKFFKITVTLRWRYKFFHFPLDYWLYEFIRKQQRLF